MITTMRSIIRTGWRRLTRAEQYEAVIEALRKQLSEVRHDLGELQVDADEQHARAEDALRRLAQAETRATKAEMRLEAVGFYLADMPPSREEIPWAKDDARSLAAFLDGPTGEKLLRHMTNRLADYERAAVIYGTPANAALACKRAHGFRDARGELLRLSAAGPSPATHEPVDEALPAELEALRA